MKNMETGVFETILDLMECNKWSSITRVKGYVPGYQIISGTGGFIKIFEYRSGLLFNKINYRIELFAPFNDNPLTQYHIKSESEYFERVEQIFQMCHDHVIEETLKFFK